MLWLIVIACGSQPPPTPAPKPASSALSDALQAIQSGPPDVTPESGTAPPTAPATREAAPQDTDPDCLQAKADRDAQQRSMEGAYNRLAAASDKANAKGAEMSRCVFDAECAADGKRAAALKKELEELEDKAAQAADALGPHEAKLFSLDQAVSKACTAGSGAGDPRRR